MVGSTAVQLAIAATLIVIPMLHPERFTLHLLTPLVFTPPPPRPPLPVTQSEPASSEKAAVPAVPITVQPVSGFTHRVSDSDTPPTIATISNGWDMGTTAIGNILSTTGNHGTEVTVAPTKTPSKPLKVSGGVIAGRLIIPIHPIYPAIARAAHVSGSVIVEAIISKAGTIESLHVVSGPEMLRAAALGAIRGARYNPFQLNGEPTEVQTTITVNFTMGG